MLRKSLSTVICILFITASGFAQSVLEGTVTDAQSGETLPGVNIFIEELERGTATDVDGNYRIAGIPEGTYNLRATYIGFRTYRTTVDVSGDTDLNFELGEDLIGLDEIVVTGQGGASIEKRRLSTTVESISAKQLQAVSANQLDQVLQANLPNSQVRLSSGQPGTASLIRGRGVNSALTSTTPVIYVDGVRVDNTSGFSLGIATGGAQSSAIADIPIENIERIEVLKGGAATTLYGSDAANGVIQIFTQKGVQGATRFTLRSNVGAVSGTRDFLKYDETADILFETGMYQEYSLSGSGGTEDITYSFSGTMIDNDGFRPNNEQVRHNLRTSISAQINPVVNYNGSIGFTSNEFGRDYNANTSFSTFGNLEGGTHGDISDLSDTEFADLRTEVADLQGLVEVAENVKRFQTSHQLQFDLMDDWSAKALVGLDSRNSRQREAQTNRFLISGGFVPDGTTDQGSLTTFDRDFLGITVEASTTYRKDFGDFSSITALGGQLFRTDDRQINATANEVPDGSKTINSGASVSAQDFRRTVAQWGGYVNENFGYKDRYYVEVGLRVDGNTAFGEEVGPQYYPKIGASYSISSEPFFRNAISTDFISNLKFRANFGVAGNFPTPFSNKTLANIDPFLGGQSIEFGAPGDPELKPEKSTTYEIGGDLAFVNDRISFEATYFQTVTEDALFNAPFARSTGLTNALRNIGEIENSGIEVSSNFVILQSSDYGLRFNASFNTLTNEVTSNGGTAPFAVGGFSFLGSWVDEGKSIGYFRGNNPIFAEDGSLEDVEPNANLGSPIPDYFGTFGVNANYKNLSLTISTDYQKGAQGVNTDEVLRFFSGLSDDRIPEASMSESFFDLAGVWVEETEYLKVRLISLDYAVPEQLYDGYARRISIGASIQNPLNFAASTFDPEITGASIGTQGGNTSVGVGGFGFGTESPPRTFLGKVRIDF